MLSIYCLSATNVAVLTVCVYIILAASVCITLFILHVVVPFFFFYLLHVFCSLIIFHSCFCGCASAVFCCPRLLGRAPVPHQQRLDAELRTSAFVSGAVFRVSVFTLRI